MKQGITVRDFNRKKHEFWRSGDLLFWYLGGRTAGSPPDASFYVRAFRLDEQLLRGQGGAGPAGQYGLLRSSGFLGVPHPGIGTLYWFGETAWAELDRLLTLPERRKVVSV